MNSPPASDALKHLPRLYAFAQLVSPDPAAATRLVRATFQRALDDAMPFPEGDAGRLYLYRLLLDVRREERGEVPTTPARVVPEHEAPDDLAASRDRHARRLVELHLPPALVSLGTTDRLLLLLCDVEGLACDEAARVLDLPASEACERYEAAQATLRARILGAVSEHERGMLDEVLVPDRLRAGIASALQDELAPLPPTLRPQIAPPASAEPASALPPTRTDGWVRIGYLVLLVFALAIAAYLLLRRTTMEGEANLIVLAARHAESVEVAVQTDDVRVAESFVVDHVGWQLSLPDISGYSLAGVGLDEVVPGVSLPVFQYVGSDSLALTLYAANYSLLDQAAPHLVLEADVLQQLEDDAHFDLHDIDGTQVLVWRHRDDLFLAVSRRPDPSLAQRISP